MQETQTTKQGFTLIELSIVLVIIGLIVGGVLVGQDLIKAAEIRATVGQYEKYNTAINTFRTKYNGIPGDLLSTQALSFGLYCLGGSATTCTGGTGLGDGDGLIGPGTQSGESLLFWRQLSDANLIDGSYGQGAKIAQTTGYAASTPIPTDFFPPTKVGRGNLFSVSTNQGFNYYMIGNISGIAGGPSDGVYAPGMTPIETFNIDNKSDDGAPYTGTIQVRGTATDSTLFGPLATGVAAPNATTSTAQRCVVGTSATDTASTYNRNTTTGGNDPFCIARLRFN